MYLRTMSSLLKKLRNFLVTTRDALLYELTKEALNELVCKGRNNFQDSYAKRGIGYITDLGLSLMYFFVVLPMLIWSDIQLTPLTVALGVLTAYAAITLPKQLIMANLKKRMADNTNNLPEKIAFMLFHAGELSALQDILKTNLYSYVSGKKKLPDIFEEFKHLDEFFNQNNRLGLFTCAQFFKSGTSEVVDVTPLHVLKDGPPQQGRPQSSVTAEFLDEFQNFEASVVSKLIH